MESNSNPHDNIILISDYGRSGQGWLTCMLCYILNAQFIEPYDLAQGSLYFSGDKEIIRLTSGNLPGRQKTKYSMVVKTHSFPANKFNLTDKVVFLTRDPRDAAVSRYFRQLYLAKQDNYKTFKRRLAYLFYGIRPVNYIITALEWSKHYQGWERIASHHITYENLSTNTAQVVKGILNYAGEPASDPLVNEAVETFSFKRLSGREKGQENRQSIDFRKGVIGDYKNYFSKLEHFIFIAICGKEMQKAGYDTRL